MITKEDVLFTRANASYLWCDKQSKRCLLSSSSWSIQSNPRKLRIDARPSNVSHYVQFTSHSFQLYRLGKRYLVHSHLYQKSFLYRNTTFRNSLVVAQNVW